MECEYDDCIPGAAQYAWMVEAEMPATWAEVGMENVLKELHPAKVGAAA